MSEPVAPLLEHSVCREEPEDPPESVRIRADVGGKLRRGSRRFAERVRHAQIGDRVQAARDGVGAGELDDRLCGIGVRHVSTSEFAKRRAAWTNAGGMRVMRAFAGRRARRRASPARAESTRNRAPACRCRRADALRGPGGPATARDAARRSGRQSGTAGSSATPPPRRTSLPPAASFAWRSADSIPSVTNRNSVPPFIGSRRARVMRQHEHRHVVRRLVAPPALPALVRPWPADRPEHVPAQDPGADSLEALAAMSSSTPVSPPSSPCMRRHVRVWKNQSKSSGPPTPSGFWRS